MTDALGGLHAATRTWFRATFGMPTEAQRAAFPAIVSGQSTLLIAPTGSGKTLAAFLSALDRLMFSPAPEKHARCKLVYISPIKALAFDIERNLRAPLAGLSHAAARLDIPHRALTIGLRTGDTPAEERARFRRAPADILITTPESLYLMLTSEVRETLRHVDTIILDEIHALAPTKRGTHLFLSLERLEALRPPEAPPLQRIGLSATQKPLEDVAHLLGGFRIADGQAVPRPVHIADARRKREMLLSIEVPVEDMAELSTSERPLQAKQLKGEPSGEAPRSIWTSIHPRLVELVRSHRSTMVFVNNRRLAERLAAAINEQAGEPLARAHHGSVAREERVQIEDALKAGQLPCIVATSSLELGLDIGAIDLVVQIEAPPSVASGIQRVGRANHQVGENPRGTLFPKHRGDLLACAEAARRMRDGDIETTRFPKNALDVLAQQIVAMVASEESMDVDTLYARIRGATSYVELPRAQLEGVLDMLSGRYPSEEFAELRPRLTYDRVEGVLSARKSAKRLAIANAGVIPDRGLYGVFLATDDKRKSRRVGELDEEMVFEAREGEVFVLGASSWRIEEITHDRVLVTPAPGVHGKMPFWRGDGLGRSAELGRGIGRLCRELSEGPDKRARTQLARDHALEPSAAENLLRYVREQAEAPNLLPTDRRLVVERFIDEVGDYRVCLLSPFGARVHAPLAIALMEKAKSEHDLLVESVWTDDGIVLRFPERESPPPVLPLLPRVDELEELLTRALAETPLFAAHFRECASRALLLPRKSPMRRAPLWAQRKRSAALLSVATRYRSFPIVLETYRECFQDFFDMPALSALLTEVAQGSVRIESVEVERPSPFARTLLFNYVGNFMYDTDAPLAERKAAALAVDPVQLRELLGQVDLAELLDPKAIDEVAAQLARRLYPPRDADDVHDLLLLLGDLSREDLLARLGGESSGEPVLAELVRARRAIVLRIAGEARLVAAEDAARYRDGLGAMPPPGLPSAFLSPVEAPLADLIGRYARTHVPFTTGELGQRFDLPLAPVQDCLDAFVRRGRLIAGRLHPGKPGDTYADPDVLRNIKQKSLAALRRETEPVTPLALARFRLRYHDVLSRGRGESALTAALRKLAGYPISLEDLEGELLPARIKGFTSSDLDMLLASGEVFWRGVPDESVAKGKIALFFRDEFAGIAAGAPVERDPLEARILSLLETRGAVFFHEIVRTLGGFPNDLLEALWNLIWAGEVTNDTLKPLRSRMAPAEAARRAGSRVLPGSEGRFTLVERDSDSPTLRRTSAVARLLRRHGLVARETLKAEGEPGGFSAVYEVLKAMEDAGKVRRGYFVSGLGAAQFAEGPTAEWLRAERDPREHPSALVLAACDPASPYGVELPFPEHEGSRPMRKVGARVVLATDGRLLAWAAPELRSLLWFGALDGDDPSTLAKALVELLAERPLRALLIGLIDGQPAAEHALAQAFMAQGFVLTTKGLLRRKDSRATPEDADSDASGSPA
jgi:ATP-dependent Lhr-like helicase